MNTPTKGSRRHTHTQFMTPINCCTFLAQLPWLEEFCACLSLQLNLVIGLTARPAKGWLTDRTGEKGEKVPQWKDTGATCTGDAPMIQLLAGTSYRGKEAAPLGKTGKTKGKALCQCIMLLQLCQDPATTARNGTI